MKTTWLLAVTLMAGALAGALQGGINQVISEPLVDKAIGYEVQFDTAAGHNVDLNQLQSYRIWQKAGEVIAETILGTALGALFGIVYAYTRRSLPGSNSIKKAVILAGTIWFVLFLVTALKYPPNTPAVNSPLAIELRQELYVAFMVISGIGALAAVMISGKVSGGGRNKRIVLMPLIYSATVAIAYFALPANGYQVPPQMSSLETNFRIVSMLADGMLFGFMGLFFGLLWRRFESKLEETDSFEFQRHPL